MVMSTENVEQGEVFELPDDKKPEIIEKPRVSDKEKELVAEASSAYNSGNFSGCLESLEKLEVSIINANCKVRNAKIYFYCSLGRFT